MNCRPKNTIQRLHAPKESASELSDQHYSCDLPADVWHMVARKLDFGSRTNFALVNREFRDFSRAAWCGQKIPTRIELMSQGLTHPRGAIICKAFESREKREASTIDGQLEEHYTQLQRQQESGNRTKNFACYRGRESSLYDGEMAKNLPHGWGFLRYENGACFEGQFNQGKPHGWGTSTYAYGETYVGEFAMGLRHGWGICTYVYGEVYMGNFELDFRHGAGVISSNDRDEQVWFQHDVECVNSGAVWKRMPLGEHPLATPTTLFALNNLL